METRSVIPATPATLLHWAKCREQAGDLLGSGVCLREALRRQLDQLAREHGCLPKRRDDRERAAILASSLHAAGAIGDCDYEMLHSAIEVGNAAAHVGCIDHAALQSGIRTAELIVESWAEPSETLQSAAGGVL